MYGVPGPDESGVHHAQSPSLESLKRQRGSDTCGGHAMVCLFYLSIFFLVGVISGLFCLCTRSLLTY